MRCRSGLQQAVGDVSVGDVSRPPVSACEGARERLIRSGGTAAAIPGEGQVLTPPGRGQLVLLKSSTAGHHCRIAGVMQKLAIASGELPELVQGGSDVGDELDAWSLRIAEELVLARVAAIHPVGRRLAGCCSSCRRRSGRSPSSQQRHPRGRPLLLLEKRGRAARAPLVVRSSAEISAGPRLCSSSRCGSDLAVRWGIQRSRIRGLMSSTVGSWDAPLTCENVGLANAAAGDGHVLGAGIPWRDRHSISLAVEMRTASWVDASDCDARSRRR